MGYKYTKPLRGGLRLATLALLLTWGLSAPAQPLSRVEGTVRDWHGMPIPFASVSVRGTAVGVAADKQGRYQLMVHPMDTVELEASSMGFHPQVQRVQLRPGERRLLDFGLAEAPSELAEVSILAPQRRFGNIERIEHRDIEFIPNASGNFEALLKSLPGVSSRNELSAQYSVRGGNFDENLVYVNHVEIYRPFLVRAGQQEGLSFVNPDMVERVEFSAGGFNAEFGDKMSSVLNIRYRQPHRNAARAEISLLGASALVEGLAAGGRFTHLTGVRYKSNQYLLGTLDERGEYRPSFIDIQSNLTWRIAPTLSLSMLGGYSGNRYQFIPTTRETRFGTFNNTLQLRVYYEGQEVSRFQTLQGALTLAYNPTQALALKLIGGGFAVREAETFDIRGQYLLNELDNRLGSETYGDSVINVGLGGFLNHARNFLDANIYRIEHLGSHTTQRNRLRWGARLQIEGIEDHIKEWNMIDSSGFNIPYRGDEIVLAHHLSSANTLNTLRTSGFVQNAFTLGLGSWDITTTAGVRFSYWTFNRQLTLSPRAAITFAPSWAQVIRFHLSGGLYHQPPMYKELRLPSGMLNPQIRAQQSLHLVAGAEYFFSAWSRPFRIQTEIYYKSLRHIIPYRIDNVRIVYAGQNLASGYAQGVDLKINGEFVEGVESWLSLSVMRSSEDIANDFYIDAGGQAVFPGYYPRPTDQRFNVGLFFQDYIPNHPAFRVHLSGHYGSGLPFGKPHSQRFDLLARMPAYKRVDIGFTMALKDEQTGGVGFLANTPWIRSCWVGVEVFNLLDIHNTGSYMWVQTVSNQTGEATMLPVPNYLTSRRINLRLAVRF